MSLEGLRLVFIRLRIQPVILSVRVGRVVDVVLVVILVSDIKAISFRIFRFPRGLFLFIFTMHFRFGILLVDS